MTASRLTTIFCDGLNGDGTGHAPGCIGWDGVGYNAKEARRESSLIPQPGGKDYSRECLAALQAQEGKA